jgi:hypothetical protein
MSNAKVPAEATFNLTLDKQLAGKPVLENPVCEYQYSWNFTTNMGMAALKSINRTPVNITLHPLGIAGNLDFMSDMKPTTFSVNASNDNSIALIEVVIYRVILDISLATGDRKGAIMFNQDGSSIQASNGFAKEHTNRVLPKK